MPAIRRLTNTDVPRLRQFWLDRWNGDVLIVHGETFRPEQVEGFIVEEGKDWLGLVTFYFWQDECEILSLDSLRERQGLGSSLIEEVIGEAQKKFLQRIILSTTNDNLQALGFYQKRGFELVTIRRGALAETRKLKPGIPLIAENGIPIRDEIELEILLQAP